MLVVKGRSKMKIYKFLKVKKWSIIFGAVLLAILTVIAGVFSYGIESEFNNLKDQLSRISFSVSSLEISTSAFKSSIDGMTQKPDINTDLQAANSELQSKLDDILENLSELDDILKNLSELEKKAADLKISSKAIQQPTKTAVEAIALPDTTIPESPAIDHDQAQSANTVRMGQNFSVTVKANEISNLYGYQFNLNYDNKKAAYKGSLKSSVSGINTIFEKDMGDHLLVGATMIGDTPGYSGQDVTVCTMEFTATEDLDPSSFTINGVSTVDANQNYVEDISGWSIEIMKN
jgi:hypothetical protein